jgi:hypothetical protein
VVWGVVERLNHSEAEDAARRRKRAAALGSPGCCRARVRARGDKRASFLGRRGHIGVRARENSSPEISVAGAHRGRRREGGRWGAGRWGQKPEREREGEAWLGLADGDGLAADARQGSADGKRRSADGKRESADRKRRSADVE